MKNGKIFMMISVITLAIVVIGSVGTYAWYVWSTTEDEETQIVTSLGAATVYFDAGSSIENANLYPTDNKENGLVKKIKIAKNSTSQLTFDLYLDLNILPESLKHESFVFQVYRGTTLVKEGNFSQAYLDSNKALCQKNNVDHIKLLSKEIIYSNITTYTLYIWIDGENFINPNSMQESSFSFDLHAEGVNAIIKEGVMPDISDIPEEQHSSLSFNILSNYYYADKESVTNNGIVYYYDNVNKLMSDIEGNVRYYGATPNNYIYFNCDDYDNQTSDTCELWRIIGVFDNKIKIIRDESIGKMVWDYDTSGNAANTTNDWSKSKLSSLLNDAYYNNSDNVTYYVNPNNKDEYSNLNDTIEEQIFNFASDNIGIKNTETRDMILSSIWYLGGHEKAEYVYTDQMYTYERGSITSDSVTKVTWNGNIALAYPSDYGYAGDFNYCVDTLYGYSNKECRQNNWMYKDIQNDSWWLLTHRSNQLNHVWSVANDGHVFYWDRVFYSRQVRPTLYLNVEVTAIGNGTIDNPYKLG